MRSDRPFVASPFSFLLPRHPPRSTPFPYTTLFRSLGEPLHDDRQPAVSRAARRRDERSEEHTSELQSRVDLVCRLLLEKKKKPRHPWSSRRMTLPPSVCHSSVHGSFPSHCN